ncbi:hypothetical protein DXG01_008246 [Tephrocybe rancida]|nr:hypothetical protein DXG01_008246 [Tephrocybe rancida]
MHRCLWTLDILLAIFTDVAGAHMDGTERTPSPESAALLNLALTCRWFKGPALGILWRAIPGLDSIVACLPQDALHIYGLPSASQRETLKVLRLNRDINLKDFKEKADRIQVVGRPQYSHCRPYVLDPSFLHIHKSSQQAVGPLLTSVKHAMLYATDFTGDAVFPRLIIGPKLLSIDIMAFNKSRTVDGKDVIPSAPWEMIGRLLTEAARVQVITIDEYRTKYGWELGTFAPLDIVSLLRGFQSLKVLRTLSLEVDRPTFLHLSTLPYLEELALSVPSGAIMDVVKNYQPYDQLFPNLSKLRLNTSGPHCASLFQLPRAFERLKALEVRFQNDGTWSLRRFFQSIRTNTQLSQNLTSFKFTVARGELESNNRPSIDLTTITSLLALPNLSILHFEVASYPWEPPSNRYPIDFTTIAPLLALPNLSVLHLEGDGIVNLTNANLLSMGASWPRLEVLEFPERTCQSILKITLVGLLPLLASCAYLRELTLRVDAREDALGLAEAGTIVPHRALAEFCHCRSPITNPDGVAAFLQAALSGLETLSDNWLYVLDDDLQGFPQDSVEQGYMDLWGEVERQVIAANT